MLELPNYSSQLMQQLWALKKGGLFCDCTVFVGDSPHRAHKLLLAASSMLFRSLLASSDSISIDTAVVSSQEFGCLLDMVYTGKLPLGKHNVSRIITAADNLQMFDVAISFKKVLSTIVPPECPPSKGTSYILTQENRSTEPTKDLLLHKESPTEENSPSEHQSPADRNKEEKQEGDSQCTSKSTCKTEPAECSGSDETLPPETKPKEIKAASAAVPSASVLNVLECILKLLTNMANINDLLSQAAQSSLDQQDQQVVSKCYEQTDPEKAVEMLHAQVRTGVLSEATLVTLLWAVHQNVPSSSSSQLQDLLQELENILHTDSTQKGPGSEDTKEDNKDSKRLSSSCTISSSYKRYTCRRCKKAFDYKCRLLAHNKSCLKTKKLMHQCPQCPQKLSTQQALLRHQAQAHKYTIKKKVDCELCGRKFSHPSGMIYHMRTEHFEEKPFSCDECGAKFGANSSLKNHMRLHTGEKPYTCQLCDMSFTAAAGLAYHTKKKHSQGKMYVCQYCKAEFAQSIELTRHVRTHTGDRPYVCRQCGKGYTQVSGLTAHLHTVHNISEPFDCQKCSLSFSSQSEHEQHIQDVHPSEFHKCPVCEKVFQSATLLNKHKSTHTRSKLFSCQLCNKSYQQLSGLWYHNRTCHPDMFSSSTRQLKALLQCDVCFKFFPGEDSLTLHQAAEHQGTSGSTMRCPFCPAAFAGQDWMEEHMRTHHVEESDSEMEHTGSLEQYNTNSEVPAEAAESGGTGEEPGNCLLEEDVVISAGQAHLENAQQVFVALADGQEGGQVMEVSMFDLLNNAVTFICEDKGQEGGT